jgi:hypothetical protein
VWTAQKSEALLQIFTDAIEALKTNYKRMNPFCIPFVTTNMGGAMLAMDLVSLSNRAFHVSTCKACST